MNFSRGATFVFAAGAVAKGQDRRAIREAPLPARRRAATKGLQFAVGVGVLALAGSTALAMSTAEVCSFRGRFVETAAQMRDAGKPQEQALAEVQKAYRKQFKRDAPKSVNDYVAMAYEGREFKPVELRQLVVSLCLQELK